MTTKDAEKILKVNLRAFESDSTPVDLLEEVKCEIERIGADSRKATKERVYDHIVQYLRFGDYPTIEDPDFKEANINDLVVYIIDPILSDFKSGTERQVKAARGKGLVSNDFRTGGYEEFVVVDETCSKTQRFVLMIEAKRTCLRDGTKQCFLAMRDMRNHNGGGEVYGFVTTGVDWRMARYDGRDFGMTAGIAVLFQEMCKEKDRWMRESSLLVDFILYALDKGGNVKQDVVV